MIRRRQIGDEVDARLSSFDVQHIAALDPVSAEPPGVAIVSDLEHPPANGEAVSIEKALDVVAVHRRPPIEAERCG